MSDTIIWPLIWAWWALLGILISILSQFLYYRFIEKQKLREEREFSFRKERYFLTEKTVLDILDTLLKIDTIIRELDIELHGWAWSSLSALINPKDSLQNKLLYMENIESSIKIYFPECTRHFHIYHTNLYNLYDIYTESQNRWLSEWEWLAEYNEYEKCKETLEKELIDSVENAKHLI